MSRLRRRLEAGPDWTDALAAFTGPTADDDGCVVLDSVRPHPSWGRFSYLADRPRWVLAADATEAEPLSALREAVGRVRLRPTDGDGRFVGGWVGYLAYELGSALEGVAPAARDDIPLPRMRWAFYDAVACYDLRDGSWELSALLLDDEKEATRRLDDLEQRLLQASSPGTGMENSPALDDPDWMQRARCNFTRADYERIVTRAREYIAAGDIYQVNLSQRFSWPTGDGPAPVSRLFEQLRRRHPGWYSALLRWKDEAGATRAICSASPELFLSLRGRRVTTRPIKGTRPRGEGSAGEEAAVAELLASEKDAAELAMIVDLERNDLGRVCRFGSIRVTDERQVETHARVHHTVATVVGELRDTADAIDLLDATFPGGSITGAPKIRAMQIIAELEPTARSAYTGAVGYLGADGSAMLNIAIRTVIVAGDQVHLQVGGGIVTDSDPSAEYDETLAKAQGLAQAIAAVTG